MSDWKTITIPKTCWLPVGDEASFKDSGQRVEPTDKVEILPGTVQIRINGAERTLMRNIDHLIDAQGVLQLAKPAPPVKVRSAGAGWGVGRMGEVTSRLRGSWDTDEAENWQGDHATVMHPGMSARPGTDLFGKPDQARGFKIVREDEGSHDTPFGKTASQVNFGTPSGSDRNWSPDERAEIDGFFNELGNHMREDWVEEREVTLRDGSKATALFDKRTDKQISTPQRMYQVQRDASGQQIAAPIPTAGPNSRFDMDEYRRRLAAQMADARPAPTFREAQAVHEAKNKGTRITVAGKTIDDVQRKPDPALSQTPIEDTPAVSTGSPHLDDLLHKCCATRGWPLGSLSRLSGPEDVVGALLQAANARPCQGIEAAFGHIHLLKPGQTPLIAIYMPIELNDQVRLTIAEQLPTLADMLKGHPRVAVVIVTPPWTPADMPALLKFIPQIQVEAASHESDARFITVTVAGQAISFPRPLPNP